VIAFVFGSVPLLIQVSCAKAAILSFSSLSLLKQVGPHALACIAARSSTAENRQRATGKLLADQYPTVTDAILAICAAVRTNATMIEVLVATKLDGAPFDEGVSN
jgi:hypothetical protein